MVGLLAKRPILDCLADMLSSFTRITSYVIPVRVRKGIWRKIRFDDMDIDALTRFCETVDEGDGFSFYKRIADVYLLILGIFPEYVQFDYRRPSFGKGQPRIMAKLGRSMREYEEEGRRFYKLAAEHYSARLLELSEALWLLYENFDTAKKPLNFISEHYLRQRKHKLFEVQ